MKRTRFSAPLLMAGILLVSCSEDPSRTSGFTEPTGPEPRVGSSFDLDQLDYETISGTLQPGQSGIMSEVLTTWPKNCRFSLLVPESSMPGGYAINFEMRIPTQASYLENAGELNHRLVIRLAPDGEQFLGPITVEGTWMPWQGRGVPPSTLYYYNGDEWGEAEIIYVPTLDRYRVRFQVNHFSDWEVGPEPLD